MAYVGEGLRADLDRVNREGIPTDIVFEQGVDVLGLDEPDQISVQHILIGFEGSVPGKRITRTRSEAQELANKILSEAQSGADFEKLVNQHTDDSAPGIYRMTNYGLQGDKSNPNPDLRVFQRTGMVPAFGNTGFPLEVGEIGMADYDPKESPYGWHIIKRLK